MIAVILLVIILTNLLIGWVTTGRKTSHYSPNGSCGIANSCVVRTIFIINYILFYLIIVLTLILAISCFICFTMSHLCSEGKTVSDSHHSNSFPSEIRESNYELNLKLFAPLLKLRPNETELLLFRDHRLKKLCVDYMSHLYLYIILAFGGFLLLFSGFLNFLINLSVNWTRVTTNQKCAELMYINASEMIELGGSTSDPGPRY